jgi:hypothetical protein
MKVPAQGHNVPRQPRRKPRPSRGPAVAPSQATDAPLLSVSQVADIAETVTGKRPSPSTVFRWMTRGAGGVRLPSRRIGGRHYVLKSSALEWFGGLGSIPTGPSDTKAAAAVSAVLGKPWGDAKKTPGTADVKGAGK